jgi:trans-aconitate 2-methyltransferase
VSSADYYDDYAAHQVQVGINDRHRAIMRWLKQFGLTADLDVLELGCGVGTLTELLARALGDSGTLVAVDSSPKSVELAGERLRASRNVELITADIVDLTLERSFDVVVLPDVIEHVPIESHSKLFASVRRWVRDTGWVLVHMPNPFFLEWCHTNRPDLLQQLDQPVHTDSLVASTHVNDLAVHYLDTYSIWVPEGDYQVIVLRPRSGLTEFTIPSNRGFQQRVVGLAKRLLKRTPTGFRIKR